MRLACKFSRTLVREAWPAPGQAAVLWSSAGVAHSTQAARRCSRRGCAPARASCFRKHTTAAPTSRRSTACRAPAPDTSLAVGSQCDAHSKRANSHGHSALEAGGAGAAGGTSKNFCSRTANSARLSSSMWIPDSCSSCRAAVEKPR